jgi:hypothetical protein
VLSLYSIWWLSYLYLPHSDFTKTYWETSLTRIESLLSLKFFLIYIISLLLEFFAYFLKKKKPHEYNKRVALLFIKWGILEILAISGYFYLKIYGYIFNDHYSLPRNPDAFIKNIPSYIYPFLDFFYTFIFTAIATSLFWSFFLKNKKLIEHLHFTNISLILLFAMIHFYIPSNAPFFQNNYYRSKVSQNSMSLKIHNMYLKNTDQLITDYKTNLTKNTKSFFPPISVFPSYHCAFALLVALILNEYYKRKIVKIAYAFPLIIFCGSIALGFHYYIDGLVGFALAVVLFRLFNKIYGENYV